MATTVGRFALRVPTSGDNPDIPADFMRLATDLSNVALDDQGVLSARLPSTVGAPSLKPGRYWFVTGDSDATQNGRLWRDMGAGWVEVAMNRRPVLASLPGSAMTGDEILYQTAGMVTAGVGPWHLRYDSALSGTSKWKVLGADPLMAEAAAAVTTQSNAPVDLTGPSLSVPEAGLYVVEIGAGISCTGVGQPELSFQIAAAAATAADFLYADADMEQAVWHVFPARAAGAGDIVKLRYREVGAGSGTVTATFRLRILRVTPLRIG